MPLAGISPYRSSTPIGSIAREDTSISAQSGFDSCMSRYPSGLRVKNSLRLFWCPWQEAVTGFRLLAYNPRPRLAPSRSVLRFLRPKQNRIRMRHLFWCPWQESNPHQRLRRALLYPLSYKGKNILQSIG